MDEDKMYKEFVDELLRKHDEEDLNANKFVEKSVEALKDSLWKRKNYILAVGALAAHLGGVATGAYKEFTQYDVITHVLTGTAIAKSAKDFLDAAGWYDYEKYIFPLVLGSGIAWEAYEAITGVPISLGDKSMRFSDALKNTIKDIIDDVIGWDLGTNRRIPDFVYNVGTKLINLYEL
ncbi:MAG: hypothetical protein J7L45_01670 [Candidatus Aenigmarchaeota archaeon]|nr:hypothetical protein [Candidatus Aenigmarchaeota archaeon]